MNKNIEAKVATGIVGNVATESHLEASGLIGMPLGDRKRFDQTLPAPVAEAPNAVIGKPVVIIPET